MHRPRTNHNGFICRLRVSSFFLLYNTLDNSIQPKNLNSLQRPEGHPSPSFKSLLPKEHFQHCFCWKEATGHKNNGREKEKQNNRNEDVIQHSKKKNYIYPLYVDIHNVEKLVRRLMLSSMIATKAFIGQCKRVVI